MGSVLESCGIVWNWCGIRLRLLRGLHSTFVRALVRYNGEGGLRGGNFPRRMFRVSNSCETCHTIFRLLCEINLRRNSAKFLVQQLPEHLETGYGGICGLRGHVR